MKPLLQLHPTMRYGPYRGDNSVADCRDRAQAQWPVRLFNALMGGFAITEPESGSDVASVKTSAKREGDTWVINGHKWYISNAGIADFYIVFASTDPDKGSRGLSAFLVPAEAEGLRFAGAQVMSAPHPLGELVFEECRIPAGHLVGEEGRGFMLAMATLDQLRPTVGAAACGMAERAMQEALSHSLKREQFGKPLAEFQLIQEKLGRMAIELAASRMLVYRAAFEKDKGQERISVEAAMAKAYATEAAQRKLTKRFRYWEDLV